MPLVRRDSIVLYFLAFLGLGMIAAACAPTVDLGDTADTTSTTTMPVPSPTVPADTTPEPTTPLAPAPEIEIPPEFAPVEGRVALTNGEVVIRAATREIAAPSGSSPSQPTWSRDGSRLAIASLDGPVPRLDIVDGRTGEAISRTVPPRSYFFLSWSHDGTRIAALGPGPDDTTVLDILDADGAVLHTALVTAAPLWISWDPAAPRLAVHAETRLLRVDDDGTVVELGTVGDDFFAPKWIPGTNELLMVIDLEGTATLVRRSIEGGDPLVPLGPIESEVGIAVHPDGDIAALSSSFDTTDGGSGASPAGSGSGLQQEVAPRSGAVDIVDLETGERTRILEGDPRWTEWNPDGSRLLVSITDAGEGLSTWWVHEPGSASTDAITNYIPTATFQQAYLAFGDQYIEQPRLWSPAGDRFVFAELAADGPLVRTSLAVADAEAQVIGVGDVGFWSPVP